ncbi:hypothetical protein [Janthinobacterium sp. B9-8]|uniref:hypothetical protein n=1 Tax=Janthinobacterium sp. B9-8 TaxID=1236179 RepID=UPI00061CFA87|nr:hypothetical protein [Janthinobacterium sp. B9-8]AMC33299.1 hypothetical protein VN23_01025 [Janthinobacterium sp. B9-8]
MDAQIESLSADWSARNQLDAVHNKQQQSLQSVAARDERDLFTDAINTVQKVDIVVPQELQRSMADDKALGTQLLLSQMLMASALYWPQLAMTVAKQDISSSARPPPRIENALASYRAISSVTETEAGSGLAATA